MLKKYGVIIAAIIVIASFSGCVQKGKGGKEYGELAIKITDAPSITSVIVTISNISVHSSNQSNGRWFYVVNGSHEINLTKIKNVEEFLGSATLPVGHYTQIRLYVEKAVATIDGKIYNLTIPSKSIKLVRSFEIKANQTTTLLLDFNAEKSIHHADGKYIMMPVIEVRQE